ncbi:MAG TPA: hypothetical protein VGF69_01285 [Thermoanaerobaculia bacterium]
MPFLALALVLVFLLIFVVVMVPLSIALRFRASSTRRRAWGWVVTLNFFASCVSATVLLITAGVSNAWIPNTFVYSGIGLACGCALGLLGLALSRWETTPGGLHYTPNRWLTLIITLVVTARILYGFWRAWNAFQTTPASESWLANSGAAGSMGAGAAVLGYYVVYWAGLRRRVKRHRAAHELRVR